MLTVAGNPFTIGDKDLEFRSHIIANLPGLKYLDYQFIDDSERTKIRESPDDKFKMEMFS